MYGFRFANIVARMIDYPNEPDLEIKGSLKLQLYEKLTLYYDLKKAREGKESDNLSTGINWTKIKRIGGVVLEEFGPIALKILIGSLTKK